MRSVLFVVESCGRLSMITPDRYPIRHLSKGKPVVTEEDRMAVTVQMPCESAVTERYQDAFVGSSMENGATMITFDLRQRDFHRTVGDTLAGSVGVRNPTTSIFMSCRRSIIRFCIDSSSRRGPTWMARTSACTSHPRFRGSRPPSI